MKEDILEQMVDEYLQHKGYFTRHNIKFKPDPSHPDYVKNQDSNHSDIDVIGFNPLLHGPERVLAVSCKSWQGGFKPETKINELENNKIISGREVWKGFRELIAPKWSDAFSSAVKTITGETEFTYVTAVTALKGDRDAWEKYPPFRSALNNPIRILTFRDILEDIYPNLNTTMASSQVGRLLQLIKASGWAINA